MDAGADRRGVAAAAGAEQRPITVEPAKGDRTAINAWTRVLAELGLEGWELVTAHPIVALSTTTTEFFFKRPLPQAEGATKS